MKRLCHIHLHSPIPEDPIPYFGGFPKAAGSEEEKYEITTIANLKPQFRPFQPRPTDAFAMNPLFQHWLLFCCSNTTMRFQTLAYKPTELKILFLSPQDVLRGLLPPLQNTRNLH